MVFLRKYNLFPAPRRVPFVNLTPPPSPPLWDVYYVYLAIEMAMAMAMAVAVIRPGYAIGADLHENRLFIEKRCFRFSFWSFLSLLDLKNGSGSKFCTGKWYREVRSKNLIIFVANLLFTGVVLVALLARTRQI